MGRTGSQKDGDGKSLVSASKITILKTPKKVNPYFKLLKRDMIFLFQAL